MRSLIRLLWLCLAIAVCPVHADSSRPTSCLTFYSAKAIDTNLRDFPDRVLNGNLDFDGVWFEGVGYTFGTRAPGFIERILRFVHIENATAGVDVIGVKHRGQQDHVESTVAYRLNTPYLGLGPLETRLGYSLGLSYAFDTPAYERAPDGGQDRLLTYMAYELDTRLRRYEAISLVTRIHHRSGAYGLFAPKGSGSNFLAVGLRLHWQ